MLYRMEPLACLDTADLASLRLSSVSDALLACLHRVTAMIVLTYARFDVLCAFGNDTGELMVRNGPNWKLWQQTHRLQPRTWDIAVFEDRMYASPKERHLLFLMHDKALWALDTCGAQQLPNGSRLTWNPAPPLMRLVHYAASQDNTMFLAGFTDGLWVMACDMFTLEWRDLAPLPRCSFLRGMFVFRAKLMVMGDHTRAAGSRTVSLWSWQPATWTWHEEPGFAVGVRPGTALELNGQFFVARCPGKWLWQFEVPCEQLGKPRRGGAWQFCAARHVRLVL